MTTSTNFTNDYDGDEDEGEGEAEDSDGGQYPTLEMLTHPSSLSHLIVMLHDAGLASVAERAVLLKVSEP